MTRIIGYLTKLTHEVRSYRLNQMYSFSSTASPTLQPYSSSQLLILQYLHLLSTILMQLYIYDAFGRYDNQSEIPSKDNSTEVEVYSLGLLTFLTKYRLSDRIYLLLKELAEPNNLTWILMEGVLLLY
jgi:hypothetical protein